MQRLSSDSFGHLSRNWLSTKFTYIQMTPGESVAALMTTVVEYDDQPLGERKAFRDRDTERDSEI